MNKEVLASTLYYIVIIMCKHVVMVLAVTCVLSYETTQVIYTGIYFSCVCIHMLRSQSLSWKSPWPFNRLKLHDLQTWILASCKFLKITVESTLDFTLLLASVYKLFQEVHKGTAEVHQHIISFSSSKVLIALSLRNNLRIELS